ncbi:MAG: type VI secretion system tip protein VgrG [Bacteroidetes bacterium]|jgi:type VI secretion system secreted protein VgrG|nr:type VI secretion system tip protein VgrG [Bacteroidota bacterium]
MITPYSFSLLNANAHVELDVFSFVGRERMSQLYQFEVTVSATDPLDIDAAVGERAELMMRQERTVKGTTAEVLDRPVYGIVSEVQVGARKQVGDDVLNFYRFQVVPQVWKLSLSRRSRVFRDNAVHSILETVLMGAGLRPDVDFQVHLGSDTRGGLYEVREFCVQYKESDFAFISRLMEHEGIFYYFEMEEAEEAEKRREVLVITDGNPADELPEVEYQDSSASDPRPAIHRMTLRRTLAPGRVKVWNNDIGDFKEHGHSNGAVSHGDEGVEYEEDGEWLQERREATEQHVDDNVGDLSRLQQRLAQVARRRSEEIAANQAGAYRGQMTDPRFWAGAVVEPTLWDENGPGDAPALPGGETRFLITSLHHAGAQRSGAHGGFDEGDTQLDAYPTDLQPLLQTVSQTNESAYAGAFTCIPAATPYRAPRTTPVPRVPGILTAKIEDQGEATVDAEGRYRLRMHFDHNDNGSDTEGSTRPVHMAQPYSGPDYGFHFPNREGAEAVVAFIDGDINRPVMLSTVPTPKNHTVVPNTKHKLPTQNAPEGAGAAAVAAGEGITPENQEPQTFDANKNVIQTQRGHRLVMDDNDGTSNVGISLQVGKSPIQGGTADAYWASRIDMGGYRKKAFIEQFMDSASHVHPWLGSALFKRLQAIPEYAGLVGEITASAVSTGDYIADTFGDTAPVGIGGVSSQDVKFAGANGVNLIMPNLLGAWGVGILPGIGPGNHRVGNAIVNFLINVLYQDTIREGMDFAEEVKKKSEDADPDFPELGKKWSRLQDFYGWEKKKKLAFVSGTLQSAMGMPAINLKSAAGINLAAFSKTSVMGGYGGIELESKSVMNQSADLDFNIEAGQSLVIKTKGKPIGSPGFLGVWPRLAGALPLVKNIPFPKKASPKPSPEDCSLTLLNENQDINLYTPKGSIQMKAEGMLNVESTKGSILANAMRGSISLRTEESGAALLKSGISLQSSKAISFVAGDGKASITLHPDGTIDISGTKVTINGSDQTLVKGGKTLDMHGKTTTINASAPAAGSPPQMPEKPDVMEAPVLQQMDPAEPSPDASKEELKRIAALNMSIAEYNAAEQRRFQKQEQEYNKYIKALEKYYTDISAWVSKTGQSTATLALGTSGIKADTKSDVKITCTNYSSDAKLKSETKGTMIDANAKGILSIKGAMTKIG